jgi:putative phosphoserine phosphatase / 1-acylglycerol-3-phosphate O-acyltransferase
LITEIDSDPTGPRVGVLGERLSQLRTVAGLASLAPVATGGICIGLLARSKRRGVNFFASNWPQLMLAFGGVSVNLIGDENLTAQRPAVFIFNHRNAFDVFVAAALVRDNWTAVGKKELQNDPIAGTIGRIVDAAFIERGDPRRSVEGLHKVEELARKGLSIIIAPEGTRVPTAEVGPFKKGPFRIAMTVGIPIVPIVIRNAEVMGARDSMTLSPGTVDVAVLPPIAVGDWTVADLPDRIAVVRQHYLDMLRHWPAAPAKAR